LGKNVEGGAARLDSATRAMSTCYGLIVDFHLGMLSPMALPSPSVAAGRVLVAPDVSPLGSVQAQQGWNRRDHSYASIIDDWGTLRRSQLTEAAEVTIEVFAPITRLFQIGYDFEWSGLYDNWTMTGGVGS
jgi:hypothetical protein